ncbi:MAG: 4Fe-4S binding protein [Lachnospiraceae bacterium]|nr:4Fe-4S binding protein [Lachnospiraceae bacterium]
MDRKKRTWIQAAATLIQNANIKGFFEGRIFRGSGKQICVPGLNCYSCPGAVGACPIGSLQNALSARHFRFPYYVVGLMLFFGFLLGRLICGLLCPLGFLQDLLHRISFPLKLRSFPGERLLRKLKYVVLILLVIVLPLCVKLTPFFCKYLCPSGTLAGLLLAFSDTTLFSAFGSHFAWKACLLGMIVLLSLMIRRPFCKYLCPLGAFYGFFNRISLVRLEVDHGRCIHCQKCARTCEMGIDPVQSPNSFECIRCGECSEACPTKALQIVHPFKQITRSALDTKPER